MIGYDFGKSTAQKRSSVDFGAFQVNSTPSDSANDKASDATPAKTLNDQKTEAIAREALSANAALNSLAKLGTAKIGGNADDPARSDVEWDLKPASAKELNLHITVSVRDSKVVAERIEPSVNLASLISRAKKEPKFPIFLNTVYGCFLTFGALYAIYRYAKRTLQKEVSHLRTLVVAALFCVSYSVFVYSLGFDELATRISETRFTQIAIISAVSAFIVLAVMGLLVGVGYGSGEGEVREAYPGKLTSLDALLAGRIFSRDVAASIWFGAAAAGWLLLCQHALGRFLNIDILSVRSDALRYTFARLPWLMLLIGRQYDSLLIAVAGLLLPASFLLRSAVRKRRRFGWLIIFALLSVLIDAAKYPTVASSLLAMAIYVGALLLPFFAFDLLAAMVGLSALAFVNELAQLMAVFPSWSGFAVWLGALAAPVLVLAAYLALHGRRVREEDVRPLYAKNLAERMSMQAEILAAREAQLRLLPQTVPEVPGVQFAACCLPARGVGGDFYDFFRLDANRVGIFVAQGGDQGLASALCIALAKGVLMHASLQPHSPAQIIAELEDSMAELLESGIGGTLSFAYGVMDTRRNLLNYARIGTSPRLLVYRRNAGLTTSAQLERVVTLPNRSNAAPQIYEGAKHAQPGDHLIFFTVGITSLHSRRFGRREYQWLNILMREFERPDEPLQSALVSALSKHQSQASDDLTAVVLRIIERNIALEEVVA